jgi:hypothetical protein
MIAHLNAYLNTSNANQSENIQKISFAGVDAVDAVKTIKQSMDHGYERSYEHDQIMKETMNK